MMRHLSLWLQLALALLVVLLFNGSALKEVLQYQRWDASLIDSMHTGEDELRYLGKIREASEGKWLMGNAELKEYSRTTFSPSGFLEWIPAVFLRAFGGDLGLMLLFTDLLCTAIVVFLTWAWLRKFLTSVPLLWSCMFVLFFSVWGGSLAGLLRDAVPKFSQPFASLYVLLLALPRRDSLKSTALRSGLIGIMYHTYPYHWSLFIVCEGLLFLCVTVRMWTVLPRERFRRIVRHASASFLPFAVIAAPYTVAKHIVLQSPDLAGFYSRYHIVFTHIPAAPVLQVQVLSVLVLLIAAMAFAWKRGQAGAHAILGSSLALLLPLVAMMILLNSNVLTGQDPEWLGHGARVISPIATVAVFAAFAHFLRPRIASVLGVIILVFMLARTVMAAPEQWQRAHVQYDVWQQSSERQVLAWLDRYLPPEQVIAAPRPLSALIPVFTSHHLLFGAGAHLCFVSLDELTDRYLGWAGLYPKDKEPTSMATLIVFGNHPGAQWSKERTLFKILHPSEPFTKTMADYIDRQDLRQQIDREHAFSDPLLTATRLNRYHTDVIIATIDQPVPSVVLSGFSEKERIGNYEIWLRDKGMSNAQFPMSR